MDGNARLSVFARMFLGALPAHDCGRSAAPAFVPVAHLNKASNAMTQQLAIDQADTATVAALPHQLALQEINIYSHSTLLYWWPAWAFGFLTAILNAGQEKFLATAEGGQPSSALGLTYVSILLLLIVFTNVRLRGIHSVVAL